MPPGVFFIVADVDHRCLDLAAGYHVSDLLIQRAIEVDHKQGISSKFLAYMNKLDSKVGSTGESAVPSSSQLALDATSRTELISP